MSGMVEDLRKTLGLCRTGGGGGQDQGPGQDNPAGLLMSQLEAQEQNLLL